MQSLDPILLEPAIFWFWNATPSHCDINRQLDAFHAAGFRSVYIHPMPQAFRPKDFFEGMEVEYLSDAYFDLVAYACDAMKSREMILWLYDEGGWPSGMAGGKVVAENPSFGAWMLQQQGEDVRPIQMVDEIAYPDLMNPAATDCFIRHTHEKYRTVIGHEFGRTVRGIFTDEPRLLGRLGTSRIPYSPLMPAAFEEDHGDELRTVVHNLFISSTGRAEIQRLHRAYLRTLSRLIAANYYQRIAEWCSRHGLLFEGHHSGEDDFARHGQYFGNYLEQASHYHVPGVDTIWRQIFPHQAGGNYVQLASSAARLRGGRVAVSESFAVYGAGLTLEQMKWIAAFQIVRGVNKIGAMCSLLSAQGARRISVCTDLSPRSPQWRDMDLWTDFVRRAAQFSASGKADVRVGVFYRGELVCPDRAAEFNQQHERLCEHLHDQLVGWAFVPAEALSHAIPCSEGAKVGELCLAALVVHVDGALEDHELAAIHATAHAGARVIWLAEPDNPSPAHEIPGIECVTDLSQIDLRDLSSVKAMTPLSGVRLLAWRESDASGYLFFNQGSVPVQFSFALQNGTSVERLTECDLNEPLASMLFPAIRSNGAMQLRLDVGEMRAFRSTTADVSHANLMLPRAECALNQPWMIRRERSFVIEDDVEISESSSPWIVGMLGDYVRTDPDFSGELAHETVFILPEFTQEEKVILDLGQVYYSAEIAVNGQPAGRRAWHPFLLDITRFVRPGQNTLRVRVANTLANQWMRADLHAHDLTHRRNMYLDKVLPFMAESLHCGLVGPVVARIYAPQPRSQGGVK